MGCLAGKRSAAAPYTSAPTRRRRASSQWRALLVCGLAARSAGGGAVGKPLAALSIGGGVVGRQPGAPAIYCISDLHTDRIENMAWLRSAQAWPEDAASAVAVVAGDVSHRLNVLEETLGTIATTFSRTFFMPGNHELWVDKGEEGEGGDSLAKLELVLSLCASLGVETTPSLVGNAALFASVAGSSRIDAQVRALAEEWRSGFPGGEHSDAGAAGGEHVHVFGHSHRPKDFELRGCRYVHNPVGKGTERDWGVLPEPHFLRLWDEHGQAVPAERKIIRYWAEIGRVSPRRAK
ncbi:hypothetical protein T492DRAFT_943074 [Pavlovales sp. CCMP2436]|nr:hypothetical protein T492DRAFT_943074 [Pavlovales sp. CCMP2436]